MLLLDSQAALWLLSDNSRLGPRSRRMITSATAVHVSAATVWELTIRAMLGKLTIPPALASRLTEQGLILLDVTAAHAEGIRDFPELTRHDPFDRVLIAQAAIAGLQLLTADKVLLALDRSFVTDATR